MVLLMFFQAVYFGHFLSFYTMQLEPPKYYVCKNKNIVVQIMLTHFGPGTQMFIGHNKCRISLALTLFSCKISIFIKP